MSIVQTVHYTGSADETAATVTISGTTAGNSLVVAAFTADNSHPISTVKLGTSTPATTYSLSSASIGASQWPHASIFYLSGIAAGQTKVTATPSASDVVDMYILEMTEQISGLDAAASPKAYNGSTANPWASNSASATQSGDLAVAAITMDKTFSVTTSGYTTQTVQSASPGASTFYSIATQILGASGSYSIGGAASGASFGEVVFALFKLTSTSVHGKPRSGGAWVTPTGVKVRSSGAWVTPTAIKVRSSGAWVTPTN
jgi:hypothetical protein